MISILKNGDQKLSGDFDYWVCFAEMYSKRSFFIFLINEQILSENAKTQPWFSFIHREDNITTMSSLELINLRPDKSFANFLYSNKSQSIDQPVFKINNTDQKRKADEEQIIAVSSLNNSETDFVLDKNDEILSVKHVQRECIDIQLRYSNKKQTYICNLRFYFQLDNFKLYNSWLDFGSEASQYGFLHQEQENIISQTGDIFSAFKRAYRHDAIPPGEFHQWDNSGKDSLIKTRIYYSEDVRQTYNNIKNVSRFSDSELLLYLKRITTISGYENLLPNLKLMLSQPGIARIKIPTPEGDIVELSNPEDLLRTTAAVLSAYCLIVIKNVCADNPSKNIGVSIRILFPNTLSQLKITYLLNEVYAKLFSLSENEKPLNFKALELDALSESDATFLSKKTEDKKDTNKFRKGDLSLAVDCGKGTTDIGLYYFDGEINSRILRTGLPAAGNFLTFAVSLATLHSYVKQYAKKFLSGDKLKESIIRAWLKKIVDSFSGDESQLLQSTGELHWNVIDNIKIYLSKFDYESLDSASLPDFPNPLNATSEKVFCDNLFERLENINTSLNTEFEGKIGLAPYYIIQSLKSFFECLYIPLEQFTIRYKDFGLKKFYIKSIKLSGRGFLFKPLRDYLHKQFIEKGITSDNFYTPELQSFTSWKAASIDGITNMDKLKDSAGILDYALTKLTGFDAIHFNYIKQKSNDYIFKFNSEAIICGSHKLKMAGNQMDNFEYKLWFDGLQYRYTKKNGESHKKQMFIYEPEHQMKNDRTKVLPLISQFPNIDSSQDLDQIVNFLISL